MSYRDRETNGKPRCFGDPAEHDMRDRTCIDCRFNETCAIIVRNKNRESSARRDPPRHPDVKSTPAVAGRKYNRGAPAPEDLVEREDDGELGFGGALLVNGLLSGTRSAVFAVADELVFAIDQIPRYPYPDPFEKRQKRAKREKVRPDDDEDD